MRPPSDSHNAILISFHWFYQYKTMARVHFYLSLLSNWYELSKNEPQNRQCIQYTMAWVKQIAYITMAWEELTRKFINVNRKNIARRKNKQHTMRLNKKISIQLKIPQNSEYSINMLGRNQDPSLFDMERLFPEPVDKG